MFNIFKTKSNKSYDLYFQVTDIHWQNSDEVNSLCIYMRQFKYTEMQLGSWNAISFNRVQCTEEDIVALKLKFNLYIVIPHV